VLNEVQQDLGKAGVAVVIEIKKREAQHDTPPEGVKEKKNKKKTQDEPVAGFAIGFFF
jgi:hypothetical protein